MTNLTIANDSDRWGAVTQALHWLMALMLAGMVIVGLLMVDVGKQALATGDMSLTVLGVPVFDMYQLHKSFGFTLFVLAALRLVWRFANPVPALPDTMPAHEKLAAHGGHIALYGLMLALPITGWLMASASPLGIPTIIFGLFTLPHPIGPDAALEQTLKQVHFWLAMALVAVVAVHAAAALKHHFINRDGVLARMVPGLLPRGS